jgi:hypothetical protein
MREMGISRQTINAMCRRGLFQVHYVKGLGGKWGHPVPVLYTDKPIDTCNGRGREHADVLWGTLWRYVADRVPDDLRQTLVRVPYTIPCGGRVAFMGWKWICPGCRQTRRVLYYPLPPVYVLDVLEREVRPRGASVPRDANDSDAPPRPLPTFACMQCHQVMFVRRFNHESWNRLIAHLTGGLVYGHEVPRPDWWKRERKVAFHPILRRTPSKRRQMILEDILAGLSYQQIMRKQGIAKSTVSMQALVLYRQHGVKGPAALRAKLGASDLKAPDTTDKAPAKSRAARPREYSASSNSSPAEPGFRRSPGDGNRPAW